MRGNRTRLTLIVGIVVIVVLMLVSWFFILSPRLAEASKVQAEADRMASSNLALRNQYNREMSLAKEAPAAAQQAQALFATMPEQADLPTVIEQIMAAAEAAGIPAKQVDLIGTSVPKPVAPRDAAAVQGAADAVKAGVNIATMQIDISAGGSADQVMAFLDNLQALDRALLITSTQVTNSDGGQVNGQKAPAQSVQIGGTMFVLESRLPDLVASIDTLLPEGVQASAGATASPSAEPGTAASAAASPAPAPSASSTPLPLQP